MNTLEPSGYLIFAVVGILTGIINTLAGSGSLITLPVFMFICGLPPSEANATNRIGVFMQSAVATERFNRTFPGLFKGVAWLAFPAILGSLVGSKIAVDLDEKTMNAAIGTLMVLMLLILLFKPQRWLKESSLGGENRKGLLSIGVYFFLGVYGGFLQAGIGIFLLAAMVLVSKYNLKQANGLKLVLVLLFTIPALGLFLYYGKVHWLYGILMGAFQAVGAWLGVRFIAKVPGAEKWIYRLLILVVAVSAAKLFFF